MSRKKSAPKKLNVVDPKYKSVIIPKLINSLMYEGKKTIAEKIVYDAIDKIKSKSKIYYHNLNGTQILIECRFNALFNTINWIVCSYTNCN